MITVSISINGEPIYARTAVNRGRHKIAPESNKVTKYELDTKKMIYHNPNDGVIVLAKKMLDTIHEVKKQQINKYVEKVVEDKVDDTPSINNLPPAIGDSFY